MPTPSIDRLHQFAVAVKVATDEANAALHQPIPAGATAEAHAAAVLDTYIVAIVDATIQACAVEDSQWRDALAVLPWAVGAPINAHVFFYNEGEE